MVLVLGDVPAPILGDGSRPRCSSSPCVAQVTPLGGALHSPPPPLYSTSHSARSAGHYRPGPRRGSSSPYSVVQFTLWICSSPLALGGARSLSWRSLLYGFPQLTLRLAPVPPGNGRPCPTLDGSTRFLPGVNLPSFLPVVRSRRGAPIYLTLSFGPGVAPQFSLPHPRRGSPSSALLLVLVLGAVPRPRVWRGLSPPSEVPPCIRPSSSALQLTSALGGALRPFLWLSFRPWR